MQAPRPATLDLLARRISRDNLARWMFPTSCGAHVSFMRRASFSRR